MDKILSGSSCTIDGAFESPRQQDVVTNDAVYRTGMRYIKSQVDDQTYENLHTIALRLNLTLAKAIRRATDHYLASFPISPLEGDERLRLRRRGAPIESSEDSDQISFVELFAELDAQEESNGF